MSYLIRRVLEKFDGQVMRLTPRVARFLSYRKGDKCFKEIVNQDGIYFRCMASVDNGRMVVIDINTRHDSKVICSDEYGQWRVVEQTISDQAMQELGIERSFPDDWLGKS